MRQIDKRSLLLVLTTTLTNLDTSTSSIECQFTSQKPKCIHKGLGTTCGNNVAFRGVGIWDVERIVDMHNRYRSRVAMGMEPRAASGTQPQASNMRTLEWDYELAQLAQSHADQCVFQHECPECRRVSRFGVGQNLCISAQKLFNSTIDWEWAISTWYNEVELFTPESIESFRISTTTERYTQLMWSDTYKIGCGFTMFLEGDWWKKLYTCDYGPSGNIISYKMYDRGYPCSACPIGTNCSSQYPGLCAPSSSSRFNPSWIASRHFRLDDFSSPIKNDSSDNSILDDMEKQNNTLDDLEDSQEYRSLTQELGFHPEAARKLYFLGGYGKVPLGSLKHHFTNVKGLFQVLLGIHSYSPDRYDFEDDDPDAPIFLSTYTEDTPVKIQKRSADVLLACDHHLLPCNFSAVGSNWISGESFSQGRYTYTVLETGQRSLLRYNGKVASPMTGNICVVLSHLFYMNHTEEDISLPEFVMSIEPEDAKKGSEVLHANLHWGDSGVWKISRITVENVTTSFSVILTVGPVVRRTTVALNALKITDGICTQ